MEENRLENLRLEIDRLIMEKQAEKSRHFISHLYGVSGFCGLLALRRGLNAEIAATCGMLHDIYQITDGTAENHAVKGAETSKKILQAMNAYSDEEIEIITVAVAAHSDKVTEVEEAKKILKTMNTYSSDDIENITAEMAKRGEQSAVYEPYCELLKDADVLDHCLYNPDFPVSEWEIRRYKNIVIELGCIL